MKIDNVLEKELETYDTNKEELLREHEGKFVLIKGEEVIGIFRTELAATNGGHKRFGYVPILVREITRKEAVYLIKGVNVPCLDFQ